MLAVQLLINGLALGAAYALVALGFVLVLNATSSVNFAQGDMVMAGGYVAIALAGLLPVPGIVLLPLVLVVMAGLGLVLSAFAYFPLRSRPPTAIFISTIAIGIILQNSANLLFGAAPRTTPALLGGGQLAWGGLVVSTQSLAIIAVAAALAGAAGVLLANQFFVTPSSGTDLIIKAYIAATIGGWGSLAGAVAGALLIALFEIGASAIFSYTAATAALYFALLAILFLRPQGLFGETQ